MTTQADPLSPFPRALCALGTLLVLPLCACSTAGGTGDARAVLDGVPAGEGGWTTCERRILVADVTNARDLGGHPLAGGQRVACRQIMRGGDLGGLSQTGCAELSQLGIKTVVDLRQQAVQQSEPAAACVAGQATTVDAALPKLLPDTPANYLALLKEKNAVAALFSTLGDAARYPVYVHCVIGRDRASFASALVLLALSASRQTVIDEFKLSADAGVAVQQPCIEALLDELDKLGGVESYLTSAGVTAGQLGVLRARARVN